MSSYTYSQVVTALGTLLEVPIISAGSSQPSSDSGFNNILPTIINDAEQRIWRECDFIAAKLQDSTVTTTASSRSVTIPSEMIVVQSLCLLNGSTRVYALRSSVDTINSLWPTQSNTQSPTVGQLWYAMLNNSTAIVAPTPDSSYTAEFTGAQRPSALSSSNPTTYLTQVYPDLFLAACMVFGSSYQQNWNGTGDNTEMAITWEKHYQDLKSSAIAEEQRRRGITPEV